MAKYKRKSYTVEALQWNGANAIEMAGMLKGTVSIKAGGKLSLVCSSINVRLGEYAVKDDGKIKILPANEFFEKYEEIT